jgi:SAM-dependent methyltransferase
VTDDSPSTPERSSAYDRMVYFGHPFSQTHPDRLATMASLHAMEPAPPARCRVLELGCADGGNLIPMAYQWPDSEFIGVDLSERAIGKAVETAAELGLGNTTFRRLDILDIGADFGRFDYIIAHGVYSWVPPPVRAKIMAIFRQNLAPAGVAYVSYNAYPGSHLRDMAREMMLFHVRAIADPQTRVDQARAMLKALADASDEKELYGFLLHDQWERVRNKADARLYHDDLDEEASAFFLTEVVEEAARHGLQYLSDATFSRLSLVAEPESVVRMISQIPETDAVSRNQYLDFIEGTSFRDTLLCHQEVRLRRPIAPACIKNYHVAAYAVAADEGFEPGEAGAARFTTDEGGTISIDHPVSKAALLHLGMIWPQAVGFPELVERACVLLGAAAGSGHQADVEALMTVLFRLVSAGTVTLHLYPPRLTTVVGERPHASLLARKQAMLGPLVTNLRHNAVWLEDETVRQFLVLVDGSRTIEEIVRDLNAPVPADAAGNSQSSRPQVTREDVERNLATMARLGLLIA